VDTKSNQIAPAQLAINGEVEESEFPGSMIQLQSHPDGPDVFQLQWRLLSEQLALVRGATRPLILVLISMNGSSVEGKEAHGDLDRRALADQWPTSRGSSTLGIRPL